MSVQLARLLKPYRAAEDSTALALVVGDDVSIRCLAAWTTIRPQWKRPPGTQPKDPADRWDWIMRGVLFDRARLAQRMRVSEPKAHETLLALVGARMAYPDGTLSEAAAELVAEYVQAKSPKARARLGGRPKGATDTKPRKPRGKAAQD